LAGQEKPVDLNHNETARASRGGVYRADPFLQSFHFAAISSGLPLSAELLALRD
jgi:hypothetical protein